MTEFQIQNGLWHDRGRQSLLVCPNYTPADWWECDLWLVTKAGYAVEFEIKVSVEDFKADAKKAKHFYEDRGKEGATYADRWKATLRQKHDLLATRDVRCPTRFYYVTPHDSGITLEMIPEWAGFITAECGYFIDWKGHRVPSSRIQFTEVRPAPKLHKTPVKDSTLQHCRSVFFYRYWNLRVTRKSEKILTEQPESAESPQLTGDSPAVF